MRAALDTNVVVSVLFFPSKLMDEVFRISSAPGNRLVLSNYVVDETVDVIGRKWPYMVGAAVAFLALLDFDPADDGADAGPDIAIRDSDDLPVIVGAVRGDIATCWSPATGTSRTSTSTLRSS